MRERSAFLALALLACLQTAAFPGHWFGAEGDEALYALLARSLLQGRYGLEVLPGDPGFYEVTPGWPLLLAPVAAAAGDSPLGYQAWAFLWLAVCDLLVFLWSRRRFGTGPALALTLLFGLNPLVLSRAGVVMPELPGLALTLSVLLLVERSRPVPGPLLGGLLGSCYLVRPALLPLVPACAAALWTQGRRREAAWALGLPAAVWASWRLWVSSRGGFSDAGEGFLALAGAGWRLWPSAAAFNLREACALWGRTMLPAAGFASAELLLGAALGVLACVTTLRRLKQAPADAAALFLAGSALLHAAWPWWYERYLAALLPFAILAVWEGVRRLGASERAMLRGAAVLVLLPLPFQAVPMAVGVGKDRDRPPLETYGFLKNLPPDGLIASVHYPRDAWYAGRPCVPLPAQPLEPAALRRLRVRWVLWEEAHDFGSSLGEDFPPARRLRAWSESLAGGGYRLVHRAPDGRTAVYEAR